MTTKEEFSAAIKMLDSCKSTMNCGCQYDEMQADHLYYSCKKFIEAYKRRIEKDLKELRKSEV